jgi:putative inorganic carbon (HCO3(-)) transporter
MNTQASGSRLDLAAFAFFAAGLGLIQFDIRAEILLGIAAILWGVVAWRDGVRPAAPAFFLPLVVLAAITLVGSALSPEPLYSLQRGKQFLLFLVVPVTMRLAAGKRAMTVLDVIIALGAAAALVGIVQWAALGYDIQKRPRGFLSHWMTYSGVLMLVLCAAVSRLLFIQKQFAWPAVAVPALLVALVATQTRSVWIGAFLAIGVLLTVKSKKLLIALPVFVLLVGFLGPQSIRDRAYSIVDPSQNQDRFAMLEAGVAMVKDHPLFGVGMNRVPHEYLKYRLPYAVDSADATGPETRSHLHNVPMQLAAERGLPALLVFLWFVVVAGRDLWRLLRSGSAKALAATGLASLIAMLAAGLFEHNFGDSEFLIVFLALITLPFAAEREHFTAAERGQHGVRAA